MSILIETARDILLDALDDIGVHMDETTVGASDERIAVKAINRIMASLAARNVNLGFTKLTNIADPVTIPDGAMDALVSLLGFRLWPKYRTPTVTSSIVANAREGIKQMFHIGIEIGETKFPETLPTGSGNYVCGERQVDRFYTGDIVDSILAENNGSISLEDSTYE